MGIKSLRYKEHTFSNGMKIGDFSEGGEFIENMKVIEKKSQERYARWVDWLRDYGVAAAHANDGWVDREKEEFSLCYPNFDDGIEVGSLVVLGDPESFRMVVVDRIDKKFFGGMKYHYTERPPVCLAKLK